MTEHGTRKAEAMTTTWVSISVYARIHGVHRNTVAKWVKLAAVECWRKGKVVRVKNQPPAEDRHV